MYKLTNGHSKRSKKKVDWNDEANRGFTELKNAMSIHTSKYLPDLTAPFIVTTDGSNTAIGGFLSQIDKDGNERVVDYFSRKLSNTELAYAITDKELLGLINTIQNYRHFITYNISFHTALQTSPLLFKYGTHPIMINDNKHGIRIKDEDLSKLYVNRKNHFDSYAKRYIEKGKIADQRTFLIGDKVARLRKTRMASYRQNGLMP